MFVSVWLTSLLSRTISVIHLCCKWHIISFFSISPALLIFRASKPSLRRSLLWHTKIFVNKVSIPSFEIRHSLFSRGVGVNLCTWGGKWDRHRLVVASDGISQQKGCEGEAEMWDSVWCLRSHLEAAYWEEESMGAGLWADVKKLKCPALGHGLGVLGRVLAQMPFWKT